MSQKLTDRIVKALEPPAAKDGKSANRITYDTDVSGFGARITSAGTVAFVVNYRRRSDGRERRYTIGSFPDWSVAAAREEAKRLKRDVDGGGDPVGKLQADREAPTVADLAKRFMEEHVVKKRPSTQRDYKAITEEIKTELGTMKVAAVDFEHVEKLHREITKRAPYRANRTLSVLSAMFTLSIKWKYRLDNPVRFVERNPEPQRERYLSADELVRLLKALDEHPDQQVADIFRLLLWTGARCGETMSARWNQFNPEITAWTKPSAATKQKKDHTVPLSAPARQLLIKIRTQQPAGTQSVFPGHERRAGIPRSWQQVCKAAGITGLRIHDLRHSYASALVNAGYSLPVIGRLLGHTQADTTMRYLHLLDDPLRKATNAAGAILSGKKSAQVLPMRGRR
jgi:integrase